MNAQDACESAEMEDTVALMESEEVCMGGPTTDEIPSSTIKDYR